MSTKIIYKDISPTAKADSTAITTDKQSFVNLDELKAEEGVSVNNYATFEDNYWILDETFSEFPDSMGDNNTGYISKSMSDENGVLSYPVVLTRNFNSNHTSVGVTFEFSQFGEYCSSLNIKWYRDTTLLVDENFYPNSNKFYCPQNVRIFNKMVITFYKTSIPRRYVRVQRIDDGIIRTFTDDELSNISINEEITEDSSSLPINTLKFKLYNESGTEYIFQRSQPFEVRYNDTLIGLYYIANALRKTKREYEIEAVDYIGMLDKKYFVGGMYSEISVSTVLNDLFLDEKVSYEIAQTLASKTITGYLPYSTKREALRQIAFAIGGIVVTSRNDKIQILALDDTIKSIIGTSRVFTGGNIEIGDKLTGISITEHNYIATQNSNEIFNGSITESTTIIFDQPMHSLNITNGTITSSGANYATITGNGNVILTGKSYQDNQRVIEKNNPLITTSDISNIKSFEGYTLVSSLNSAEVINRLYNIYIKNVKINSDIILDSEKVGDMVTIATEFDGNRDGRIIGIDLNLRKNMITAKGVIISG